MQTSVLKGALAKEGPERRATAWPHRSAGVAGGGRALVDAFRRNRLSSVASAMRRSQIVLVPPVEHYVRCRRAARGRSTELGYALWGNMCAAAPSGFSGTSRQAHRELVCGLLAGRLVGYFLWMGSSGSQWPGRPLDERSGRAVMRVGRKACYPRSTRLEGSSGSTLARCPVGSAPAGRSKCIARAVLSLRPCLFRYIVAARCENVRYGRVPIYPARVSVGVVGAWPPVFCAPWAHGVWRDSASLLSSPSAHRGTLLIRRWQWLARRMHHPRLR